VDGNNGNRSTLLWDYNDRKLGRVLDMRKKMTIDEAIAEIKKCESWEYPTSDEVMAALRMAVASLETIKYIYELTTETLGRKS